LASAQKFLIAGIIFNSVCAVLLCIAQDVSGNELCDGIPPYVLQPDVKSCVKFFVCIGGYPVYGVCPDNYRFNNATSECAKQETVSCDIVEEEQPQKTPEARADVAIKTDGGVEHSKQPVVVGDVAQKNKVAEVEMKNGKKVSGTQGS
jgi:Chitin binding Peritrophin-A domain